jgi:hypothetical protein
MKRLASIIVLALAFVALTSLPAIGLPDKKPSPATKRACENFTDVSIDVGTGKRPDVTVAQARGLERAFEKKGVPKALKRAARAWFEEEVPASVSPSSMISPGAIEVLDACDRAGVS